MITAVVLTYNSERCLERCLQSLSPFPEILVVDSGSKDRTLLIAKSFSNVRLLHHPFQGFGAQHNYAASQASFDWILSIDSDEILTPELQQEVTALDLDQGKLYAISRRNFFNGRRIRGSGWSPDYQIKLYHRKKSCYGGELVHEAVERRELRLVHLKSELDHHPYASISDFLTKMERYSTLFAQQWQGKRSSSPCKAWLRGVWAFWKSYILKRGFLDGFEGFLISRYNGETTYYKYLKLWELNKKRSGYE